MKKRVIAGILTPILMFTIGCSNNHGDVPSISENDLSEYLEIKSEGMDDVGHYWIVYNSEGDLIYSYEDENGDNDYEVKEEYSYSYQYNSDGQIKTKKINYGHNTDLNTMIQYEYNDNGQLEKKSWVRDIVLKVQKFSYGGGRKTRSDLYSGDSEILKSSESGYNEKGENPTQYIVYKPSGEVSLNSKYKYNKQGLLFTTYDDGELYNKIFYDEQDRKVLENLSIGFSRYKYGNNNIDTINSSDYDGDGKIDTIIVTLYEGEYSIRELAQYNLNDII